MLSRRKATALRLYKIIKPRLELLAKAGPLDGQEMDLSVRDLMTMTKYAMELDLEVANIYREDGQDNEYASASKRIDEGRRLLGRIAAIGGDKTASKV